MPLREVILTIALMLGAGLAAEIASELLRLPRMLLLLAAGALLGPDVAGAIDVPLDSIGSQLVLTLGVSMILFYGGIQLSFAVLRRVVAGLAMLAVPGVVLTAVVVGAVAAPVFDVPIEFGLLLGAVLAPTDPAILVPLFERLRLRPKLAQAIVAESGLNDPIGAVLALTFAGIVLHGRESLAEPIVEFLRELAVSTALGIVFGLVLALLVSSRRAGVWRESAALAVVVVIAADYFVEDTAGGSGYLGVFLAGLIVGNMRSLRLGMHERHEQDMRLFVERLAGVMVILVFVTIGASLPWSAMADHALPALAVLATLLFVARPLVVLACLLPNRRGGWTPAELAFVAWSRETGVVPAALAGLLVTMGVPDAELIVVTVAFAAVLTLAVQSTTKPWLARRLGLTDAAGGTEGPAGRAAAPVSPAPGQDQG